ncbi:MAG: hypothetical protein J7L19_00380, partial [Dehalococcoidia bacterium]|nr:hypothetical protein [Dehalococcoidia bacterium]
IWSTREHAVNALDTELQTEASIVYEAFSLLDEVLAMFHTSVETSKLSRVFGLILLKGRDLAHAIFSLGLEGLAQEAGALLRPMLECIELLKYLRDDPQRVDEVLEGRLPLAGEIGKRTHGSFKRLRKYLNEHASHLSFTPESMLHLIDFKSGN